MSQLRVFISSTFQDLHEEREYLVRKIFPEIRALCRENGIEFTEIDLRWGLTDEEAAQGKIIRACLEEIDRCRPYFIGIIGNRYGWVPSIPEIHKDHELLARYPWVEDAANESHSLLEMECTYGALQDPTTATGAFFYFRRERRRPWEESTDEDARIRMLRERIVSKGLPLREFRDPATLGEFVYDDLVDIIQRDFLPNIEPTPLDRERRYHQAFASSRRRAYIPRLRYLEILDRHAASDTSPLLICSPSGAGKSALVSYWVERYRRQNPGAFVIEHYTGIGHGSGDKFGLIRHLIMEIADHCEVDESIPSDHEQLSNTLPTWLARIGDESLILVLDGVNQLPDDESDFTWFPDHIPPNIRLIVTSTDDLTKQTGHFNEWRTLHIDPLSPEEREALVVRYLGEYHKGLSPELMRRISSAPQTAQPLYLRTFLEELRMFGNFETLSRWIDQTLTAHDTAELFQRVLERIEDDFGPRPVQHVLRLIWTSRDGLRRSEIGAMTMLSDTRLNVLLNALDYHLLERGGRLTFFHTYFRDAVERRYCADREDVRRSREEIVRYFEGRSADARKADELPWQLLHLEAWERLAAALSDISIFTLLNNPQRNHELLEYWVPLRGHHSMAGWYERMVKAFRENSPELIELADLLDRVGTVLRSAGDHQSSLSYIQEAFRIRESALGPDHPDTAKSLFSLGRYYEDHGEFDKAEELLLRAIDVLEKVHGQNARQSVEPMQQLADVYYQTRDFARAESLCRRVLEINRSALGENHVDTATSLSNLATIVYARGDLHEAERLTRRAIETGERVLGRNHPEIASWHNNLGAFLIGLGQSGPAIHELTRALSINLRTFGPAHSETIANMLNLAAVLIDRGEYDRAREYCDQALQTSRDLDGPNHPRTAHALVIYGTLLMNTGDYVDAESKFREALAIRGDVFGQDNVSTIECYLYVAASLKRQGRLTEARQLYKEFLPRKEERLGFDHPSTQLTFGGYLELLHVMGRTEEAVELEERLARSTSRMT